MRWSVVMDVLALMIGLQRLETGSFATLSFLMHGYQSLSEEASCA